MVNSSVKIFLGLNLLVFLLVGALGCGSILVVRSEPGDARVSIMQAGSRDAKEIGKTPVEITDKALSEIIKIDPNSGDYYELVVERDGFEPERLMVPAARFVPMTTYVDVKLRSGSSEMRLASQLVQLLLNAQRFAQKGEYDRAQVELDKALEIDPKFARAMTMRGSIYYLQGRFQESLTWYEKALSTDSKTEEAVRMITEIKKRIGQGQ